MVIKLTINGMKIMQLSKLERLTLANQYLILEKLYPEEAKSYKLLRTALEDGYAIHYGNLTEHIYDELSEEDCRFVLDVLSMYRAINDVVTKTENKQIQANYYSKFNGFDGNEETKYYSYCKYYIIDQNRFEELRYGNKTDNLDLNTHTPMIDTYLKMLKRWESMENKRKLNEDQVLDILG